MSEKPSITPAQQEALEKAYAILGEHFDFSIIGVGWTTEHDEPTEASRYFYKGGRMACIGLAVSMQHALLREGDPDPKNES
jgi:hypothetical protein